MRKVRSERVAGVLGGAASMTHLHVLFLVAVSVTHPQRRTRNARSFLPGMRSGPLSTSTRLAWCCIAAACAGLLPTYAAAAPSIEWRSFDGTGNNLVRPSQGSAGTTQVRQGNRARAMQGSLLSKCVLRASGTCFLQSSSRHLLWEIFPNITPSASDICGPSSMTPSSER